MTHIFERTANLLGALSVAINDQLPCTADDSALVCLKWNDGLSVDGLASVVRLSQPGAVRLTDRLEAAGLVRRAAGHDGRTRSLHLTARGRRRCDQILRERSALLIDALSELDPMMVKTLEESLECILGRLTCDEPRATQICRLCDEQLCGAPARCPVDRALASVE
jgi:MarR family transcriptional repressor of emrRAB